VRRAHRPLVGARDLGAAFGHPRSVGLDDAEAGELHRQPLLAAVQGPQRLRDSGHRRRLAQLGGAHRLALDEAGDEARRLVEHRHHFRPDTDARRQLPGRALGAAVDFQQPGVLARQPHDEVLAGEADPVVAVGDPALERDGVAFDLAQAGGDRSEGFCEGGHGAGRGDDSLLPLTAVKCWV
jgi:hypothetical protein